jgi:hypothetical protein
VPGLVKPTALAGVAAGVAAAAGAGLAGLPALDVGAVAAGGWLAGAAASGVARRLRAIGAGRPEADADGKPNPYAVPQPWRDLMTDVLRSQHKFIETVTAGSPGPIQSRLASLADRVDDGVRESWLIAQRGAALNVAVSRLDPGEIRRRLAIVNAQPPGDDHTETLAALHAQMASVQRIEELAEETRRRLQLLAARLGEAVAGAAELTVAADPGGAVGLDGVAAGIDQVVIELHALRSALAETAATTEVGAGGGGADGADASGAAGAAGQPPG